MSETLRMLAWKAWFRGGRAWCSDGTDARELPLDECLGVKVYLSDGTKRNLTGTDWYWYCEILGQPTWCQAYRDEYRSADEILAKYPGAHVIEGCWTNDGEMRRVNEEMAVWRE